MRILVVDDEPAVLDALTRILEHEAYAVESATNGAQALEIVESRSPDLIILDLWMPVVTGWEFLRRLRALEPPRNAIPVIAVSADEKAATRSLPVQEFLPKPMDVGRLLEKVRQHGVTA